MIFLFSVMIIMPAVHGLAEDKADPDQKKKVLSRGDILPFSELTLPDDDEYRKYLGINQEKTFSISQIDSEILIIEIFSMYCPHCQGDAPVVNSFYEKLINDPELKQQIKLIGIGVGNSDYEVNFFKKKYDVKFPLFSDPDFKYYDQTGDVRTPFFIGIQIKKQDKPFVFYTHKGGMEDVDDFLSTILKESGTNPALK